MSAIRVFLIWMLGLGLLVPGSAQGREVPLAETGFRDGRLSGYMDTAWLEDTFYMLLPDGVYRWQPGQEVPALYCSLPAAPAWRQGWETTPISGLDEALRAEVEGAVSYLIAGDGALWGYNAYSGRVGILSEGGIAWQAQRMEQSLLFPGDSMFLRGIPQYGFVENGILTFFAGVDSSLLPPGEGTLLLRMNLETGECTQLPTNRASVCTYYGEDAVLLMRPRDGASMALSVMDLQDGTLSDLPLVVPFADRSNDGRPSPGGLAYDPAQQQIAFSLDDEVFLSTAGGPFAPIAGLTSSISYHNPAWITGGGHYVVSGQGLHVVPLAK